MNDQSYPELRDAINDAGGPCAVAQVLGITYNALQRRYSKGLPRTEYTGETDYAEKIAAAANKRLGRIKWTGHRIREASRPVRNGV